MGCFPSATGDRLAVLMMNSVQSYVGAPNHKYFENKIMVAYHSIIQANVKFIKQSLDYE